MVKGETPRSNPRTSLSLPAPEVIVQFHPEDVIEFHPSTQGTNVDGTDCGDDGAEAFGEVDEKVDTHEDEETDVDGAHGDEETDVDGAHGDEETDVDVAHGDEEAKVDGADVDGAEVFIGGSTVIPLVENYFFESKLF